MSVPRENYLLGGMKDMFKRSGVVAPSGERRSMEKGLDPEIVLQLFKDKFKGGMAHKILEEMFLMIHLQKKKSSNLYMIIPRSIEEIQQHQVE